MADIDPNPPQLSWTDALLLGYAPMDEDHQEFVELVEAMQKAADGELPALVEAFAAHAKAHFEAENAWMVETDFPARDCHIDEHAAVLRSVEQVRQRLAGGDFAIARRLAAELAGWFPGHADYLDSALAHWMCKRRLGGKPVVIRRDIGAAPRAQAPVPAPFS
ncbi:hemerythrin domain-containing protein [Caldimonas tepidiphila]|uniref:hemerythrin domain-containing protein n=1 Tax=Caldimonas tepidiphila TaxID=2315841 RepID=UPI000E5A8A2C|nr:hemerythrin domain-containing protein [Caldimonas tepidiphila]